MTHLLVTFLACLTVMASIAAGLGLLVRRLAVGCQRRQYVRDVAGALTVSFLLFGTPPVGIVLFVVISSRAGGNWPIMLGAAVAGALTVVTMLVATRVLRLVAAHARRERRGLCHACEYDLAHSRGDRCPECGVVIDNRDDDREAS